MSTNPRFVTRPLAAGKEFSAPSHQVTHTHHAHHVRHALSFSPEQRLRKALSATDDREVVTHACRYLREALSDYGESGKVAARMVDLIEEVIK